jgi:hypothetical protein
MMDQYRQEGYFVLESAISEDHLQNLRDSCDYLIDLMHQEMDRRETDHFHSSLVIFSLLTFHRSGSNATDRMRRAYVTQYSPDRIFKPGTRELMHLGVPFLEDGGCIADV